MLWPAGGRGGDGAWIWVIEMMVGGGSIIFWTWSSRVDFVGRKLSIGFL